MYIYIYTRLLALTPAPHPSSFSARYTRPRFILARRSSSRFIVGCIGVNLSSRSCRDGIRKREIAAAALQIMPRAGTRVPPLRYRVANAESPPPPAARRCLHVVKSKHTGAHAIRNLTIPAERPRYRRSYTRGEILSSAVGRTDTVTRFLIYVPICMHEEVTPIK